MLLNQKRSGKLEDGVQVSLWGHKPPYNSAAQHSHRLNGLLWFRGLTGLSGVVFCSVRWRQGPQSPGDSLMLDIKNGSCSWLSPEAQQGLSMDTHT